MKKYLPKTLRGRFLVITILFMLVLGIGTFTFSYIMFSNNLRSNAIHAAETNLQFIRNEIDNDLGGVKKLTLWCQTNGDIFNYLNSKPEVSEYSALTKRASERLNEEYNGNVAKTYISRIVIANNDSSKFLQQISNTYYSVDRSMMDVIKELPYYMHLVESDVCTFDVGVQEDPFLKRTEKMLPVIQPIEHLYRNEVIGTCYIQVSFSMFTDSLARFSRQEGVPVYLTICGEVYRINGNEITKTALRENAREYGAKDLAMGDTYVHEVDSGSYPGIYVSSPLRAADGCYVSIPIAEGAASSMREYLSTVVVIFLFVCMVGLLLLYLLSHNVTEPVQRLRGRIMAIAGGDFSHDPSIEWENELGDIGRNVNQLSTDISNLMEQRIRYEKQKKDYEYQMLQSQINPHFLYNTLNSIKWMATAQHADGIAKMTTALAHLLKSVSKGTSTIVSLKDEMQLLDDYFIIQEYRYGGAVALEYQIEEGLLDCPILRFTLQPIVENAIFHGIEPKGQSGRIIIHAFLVEGGDLQIDVTDDGVGMDEETITAVLSGENRDSSSFFKQVGIGSVNKRIQYNFGEKYGMRIESVLGEYTRVSILMPFEIPREMKPVS